MSDLTVETRCLAGHVCQLNYSCGGLLKLQTPAGSQISQHIPFSTSALPLRIGQKVAFRLHDSGSKIEAVDLHISEEHDRELLQVTQQLSQDGPSNSKIFHRQIRDLQRGIMKFRNAAKTEQCALILEAEKLLAELLGQPNLDGDALCQLVRRCASWLHTPVIQTTPGADVETSPSTEEEHVNLQSRIRKLLIQALSHLDLSDEPTFQAVEAAMRYVAMFIERFEETMKIVLEFGRCCRFQKWYVVSMVCQ